MKNHRHIGTFLATAACTLNLIGCVSESDENEVVEDTQESITRTRCTPTGDICAHFDAHAAAHGKKQKQIIINHLISLIKSARPNSSIHGSIYRFDLDEVFAAIEEAIKINGVSVSLVLDGCTDPTHWNPDRCKTRESVAMSRRLLDLSAQHPRKLKLTFCHNQGKGCLYYPQGTTNSIQHAKYFLFSDTENNNGGPPRPTTWISSANLTTATGVKAFNDSLTFYNNNDIYSQLKLYHDAQNTSGSYDSSFTVPTANSHVYLFPEVPGNPLKGSLEKHLRQMEKKNCEILVAHMSFDLEEMVEVLRKFATEMKCSVKVATGNGEVNRVHLRMLAKMPRTEVKDWTNDPDGHGAFHAKTITLRYTGNDGTHHRIVYTGSHNLTHHSTERSDEILVEIENKFLHDAYVRHFKDYWNLPNRKHTNWDVIK
ncbi:phospholipase D-like domain-containing protein [Sorangium cellulosum]|uniref:phospholipase D-like domain-containing protein n=1 Tax=Sorangium cellulosum TaxID=56 RepID=UPI00165174F7|nr:phospholipase D-like domain-containing protein [Sorangium cellulosum]